MEISEREGGDDMKLGKKYTSSVWFRFIVFSLLGFFFFLCPVKAGGELTIPLSVIIDWLYALSYEFWMQLMHVVLVGVPLLTIFAKLVKPGFIMKVPVLKRIFYDPSWIWVIFRVFGAVAAMMVVFEAGPEFIRGADTGATALDMVYWLGPLITVSTALMIFLTGFGFMEFVGVLAESFMRPFFRLPGRAALDCIASWLAAPPVAVLLTEQQHEQGYYSDREASIVATCFSLVGISAVLNHLRMLDVSKYFFPIYGLVCLAGVACAFVQVRIWPLVKIPDNYVTGTCKAADPKVPEGMTRFSYAVDEGMRKAESTSKVAPIMKQLRDDMLDVWLNLMPTIMAIATLGMIIATYTPVFKIITYPLVPILSLLNVPEAAAVAPTFIAGFPDQLMAAILGGRTVASEFSRFVIGVVTLNQLIYISETGAMIIKSKMPVNFWKLLVLFVERTVITLPFAIVGAMIFVG